MSAAKTPFLSVVIPAYNEAERLQKTLPRILDFFAKQKFNSEIIIVNDGSTDDTLEVISQHKKNTNNISIANQKMNAGKGAALRHGFKQTRGEWVLFMDADLSTPLSELDQFWKHTKQHQIIIGSRKMKGARVKIRQHLLRENLGKVFTWLTNQLATKGISDVTCGFKLFQGNVGRQLFSLAVLNDWSFDAEILFLAQKNKYRIKEIPVEWHNDPRTKVNMLKDGIKALQGLLKIRVNDLIGKYQISHAHNYIH